MLNQQVYWGDKTPSDIMEKLMRAMSDRRTGGITISLEDGEITSTETVFK